MTDVAEITQRTVELEAQGDAAAQPTTTPPATLSGAEVADASAAAAKPKAPAPPAPSTPAVAVRVASSAFVPGPSKRAQDAAARTLAYGERLLGASNPGTQAEAD